MNHSVFLFFSLGTINGDTIFFLFLIIILVVYIGYLHYRLQKQKIYTENIEKQLRRIEEEGDVRNFKELMNKISSSDYEQRNTRDEILEPEILDFIFKDEEKQKIFIHYTREKENAEKILEDGFKFVNTFYKTAEEVRNDSTDLIYKHNRHKSFGKYVIVICIDKSIYNKYLKETYNYSTYDLFVEQLLTAEEPVLNQESDWVYKLHPKFIKGFFNYETGDVHPNKIFDSGFDSDKFNENLKREIH